MSGFFDDIDQVWKNKRVKFISGEHKGEIATCAGFYNTYGGAVLKMVCDNGEIIMVSSREMDSIQICEKEEVA